MELRNSFLHQTGHSAFTYMDHVRNLETLVPAAAAIIRDAPYELTKGRSLTDIVLDDMMERFTSIMSASETVTASPAEFYFYLLSSRVGEGKVTRQEAMSQMRLEIQAQRQKPISEALPVSMKILGPHLSAESLANMSNAWNDIFAQVVRLTSSDDSLRVHLRNIETQNALCKTAQSAIQLKMAQGNNVAGSQGTINGFGAGTATSNGNADEDDELAVLAQRLADIEMPDKTRETVNKLIKRTSKMPPQLNEYTKNIGRLEFIADLPWNTLTETSSDLQAAEDTLNADHYGLEKVKKSILQHIAVQMNTSATKGKIICLIGPPGVGKTSIAQSVAKALGRNYGRIALGGVNNESKIRGHEHTYVGADAGIIMKAIKEAKSNNPLLVLDEIDKLDHGKGNPADALLEVLDRSQNHSFRDHFTDIEYDISNTFFFATANDASTIPGPLYDRMHKIFLPGYQPNEKYEIATRYLVPKQMRENGLNAETFSIEPEAIKVLISDYAREAGVRGLEAKLDQICSAAVLKIAKGHEGPIKVTKDDLKEYVGIPGGTKDQIQLEDMIGVVNGLSYSTLGGGILPIQVNRSPSKAGLQVVVTGNLGKVMGESATVAEELVRARAPQFGISDELINGSRLHVHAPDGAVPKDGPSAGAAFTTALVSSLTGIPIRRDVAMTGEINSLGQVTAIGGLPEKLQGALAAGVKKVLVPKENIPHLAEAVESMHDVREQLEIVPVGTIEEVLEHALSEKLKPLVEAAPVKRPVTARLRDAWNLVMNPSNDNVPPPSRQAAGPRRQTPGDYTP